MYVTFQSCSLFLRFCYFPVTGLNPEFFQFPQIIWLKLSNLMFPIFSLLTWNTVNKNCPFPQNPANEFEQLNINFREITTIDHAQTTSIFMLVAVWATHLGIYPEKTETLIRKDSCTPKFTAALFTIAKTWKQPKCPSADEWIKKMWHRYTMVYQP